MKSFLSRAGLVAAIAVSLGTTAMAGSSAGEPPPSDQPIVISASTTAPVEGKPVTLAVNSTGILRAESAHWTFGDGAEADGISTTHTWAVARPTPYPVTVTATMSDGEVHTTSININVSPSTYTLTVELAPWPAGVGTVFVDGTPCLVPCGRVIDAGATVNLTAQGWAPTYQFGRWGGACLGHPPQCTLTMNSDITVSATYVPVKPKIT